MVEGKTLLVLLLLGRCQHPARVHSQPRRVSLVAAGRALRHCWNHVEPHGNHMFWRAVWVGIHVIIVGTTWNHMGTTLFLSVWPKRKKHVPAMWRCWNHAEPRRNDII